VVDENDSDSEMFDDEERNFKGFTSNNHVAGNHGYRRTICSSQKSKPIVKSGKKMAVSSDAANPYAHFVFRSQGFEGQNAVIPRPIWKQRVLVGQMQKDRCP
jgi:hypothetical protein